MIFEIYVGEPQRVRGEKLQGGFPSLANFGVPRVERSGEAALQEGFPTEATAEPEGRWALPTTSRFWWAVPTLHYYTT